MLSRIDLNQNSPVNHFELSIKEHDEKFILVDSPTIDTAFLIIRLVNYINGENIQYLFKTDDNGRHLVTFDPHLESLLKYPMDLCGLADSNLTSEHIDVLFKAFWATVTPYILDEEIYILWKAGANRIFHVYDEDTGELKSTKTAAELKNALVYEISELVNTPEFKGIQYDRAEKSKNQHESATKLVKRLRSLFSKLLVLRIDFCFKTENYDDISIDEIRAYFAQLIKRFHYAKALPNIVGYCWKLEFGQQKGYHYHCIFFMDGNKYQNDAYYSEVIGQYWAKMTQNKGYYYNCHRSKVKYRNLAIGMAHHDNQEFFDNLDQVLLYICKQDQFLIDKRLLPGEIRVFQTSNPPKQRKPIGRPRKENTVTAGTRTITVSAPRKNKSVLPASKTK